MGKIIMKLRSLYYGKTFYPTNTSGPYKTKAVSFHGESTKLGVKEEEKKKNMAFYNYSQVKIVNKVQINSTPNRNRNP